MKRFSPILLLVFIMVACKPPVDPEVEAMKKAKEAFEKNSETVMTYLEGYQNENLDYESLFSEDYVMLVTRFGAMDTLNLEAVMNGDKGSWKMFDYELLADPVQLLPGVNADTKMMDGSVRYYGNWKITKPATDSTEARSSVVRLYESFDFDENGTVNLYDLSQFAEIWLNVSPYTALQF